jgi:arylsulfatase
VLAVDVEHTGDDLAHPTATARLLVDTAEVASLDIVTQPNYFGLSGDNLCVGRNPGSPVSPDYAPPFAFAGGTIDRVVVDVSGEEYVDYEKEVRAYLLRD